MISVTRSRSRANGSRSFRRRRKASASKDAAAPRHMFNPSRTPWWPPAGWAALCRLFTSSSSHVRSACGELSGAHSNACVWKKEYACCSSNLSVPPCASSACLKAASALCRSMKVSSGGAPGAFATSRVSIAAHTCSVARQAAARRSRCSALNVSRWLLAHGPSCSMPERHSSAAAASIAM
eukprot:scaffold55825_cov27-Tisochrysis_lutea.AAC.2